MATVEEDLSHLPTARRFPWNGTRAGSSSSGFGSGFQIQGLEPVADWSRASDISIGMEALVMVLPHATYRVSSSTLSEGFPAGVGRDAAEYHFLRPVSNTSRHVLSCPPTTNTHCL